MFAFGSPVVLSERTKNSESSEPFPGLLRNRTMEDQRERPTGQNPHL